MNSKSENIPVFRKVSSFAGLECTCEGEFRYNGKPKKVIFCTKNFGNGKATARLMFSIKGKMKYIQAAKAVAEAWKIRYQDGDYIQYRDGDIHNISADNLIICNRKEYFEYLRRFSHNSAPSVEERKRKLQLVIDEASMTKHYLETLDMTPINEHVKDYLYTCLFRYCRETLFLGEKTALEIVPECISRMYEVIMNGMCLYNYERYCKKLLLNYKKKGKFGLTGKVPKPIEIIVSSLNLDCLCERFVVTKRKQKISVAEED